ncbi:MAG: acyl-ACP--UDP-N-acetylglucosamine O-acyltransferase [Nitrospinae bacterium]|nr:acyl-ACP--UDP-N-acetylglucosamine O-acyltransferase [Nitrospinota bacterium]
MSHELFKGSNRLEIHSTAIIDRSAELGEGVIVGPYSVIGPQVIIEEGARIGPHVVIEPWTRIGKHCTIHPGAVIGGSPQDYKFKGVRSYVEVGEQAIIREYVTIHRSTQEEGVTRVGNHNFLMAYCHIAHDCTLGDQVVITNYTGLSGHVVVEDHAIISGYVAVHQFVRVGRMSIVSAQSGLSKDVPPYMIVEGRPCVVRGINSIGLRRNAVSAKARSDIKKAYRLLFLSHLNTSDALERIKTEVDRGEEIDHLIAFIEGSQRGIHKAQGAIGERDEAKEEE